MERAAKTCAASDRVHRGLLFACSTLARYGVTSCVPPSAHRPILTALDAAEAWAAQPSDPRAVRKARSEAFTAVVAAERRTADALRASWESFVPQASHVDRRASRLRGRALRCAGGNYACGAALLTLDAVDAPRLSARVPQQVAAESLIVQPASARGAPASSDRGVRQAEWEKDREGGPEGHGGDGSRPAFHEFLGAS